jgi:hypothetical protein
MSPVGVTVTTDVLQPSGGPDLARAAAFFVVGITERGDTTAPVLVRNMAEAQTAARQPRLLRRGVRRAADLLR